MSSALQPITIGLVGEWRTALEEFLHMEATRAKNTHIFYASQLHVFLAWAEREGIGFRDFRKRHFDRFLVFRTGEGRLRHQEIGSHG